MIPFLAAAVGAAMILAGCAEQQQQHAKYSGGTAAPSTKPAPHAAPSRTDGYGPSYSTYEADGMKYIKGSAAFPSGRQEGSGVLLEKIVPAEAMVGVPFVYRYQIKNMTPCQ